MTNPVNPRPRREKSDPRDPDFVPEVLDRTVIAIPLLDEIQREREILAALRQGQTPRLPMRRGETFPKLHEVIIDLNLEFPGGRARARERVRDLVTVALTITPKDALPEPTRGGKEAGIDERKSALSDTYLFGRFPAVTIEVLVRLDNEWGGTPPEENQEDTVPPEESDDTTSRHRRRRSLEESDRSPLVRSSNRRFDQPRSIYKIWPDFAVRALLTKTVSTVKADAARTAFGALGSGVVWAVVDSGIDGGHPHFAKHGTLMLDAPLVHQDFTGATPPAPLRDGYDHGTHVAGIIAGEFTASAGLSPIPAVTRFRDERGKITRESVPISQISGIAPRCKLLSLKVLDDNGDGSASNIIAALQEIQRLNDYGKYLIVHGVNLSVGYDFEPEWFACGQSPLCVEVDRLVRSGVVVVVAAGNSGYGFTDTALTGSRAAGLALSINDPGNAALGITVGATHRDKPHTYGVSYFSSKGPTGDGRLKPDLVAPGEKVISCGARKSVQAADVGAVPATPGGPEFAYVEKSGTSMAAPHVSGAIAAFLSIRNEFISKPEVVKEIFMSTATDLKRERYFQGSGLVDLMRAIQSV